MSPVLWAAIGVVYVVCLLLTAFNFGRHWDTNNPSWVGVIVFAILWPMAVIIFGLVFVVVSFCAMKDFCSEMEGNCEKCLDG